jgi:hypothetical protein
MVFWIAILVGVLFAWLAVRLGFYETWILCFNIIVSIYAAIFLAPHVVEFAPGTGRAADYGTALSLLALGGGGFAILQALSYVFLTGQFKIPFPQLFDLVIAALLGFVAGFLVLSFAALVVTTTPLAQHEIANTIGCSREAQRPNIACITRCCNVVHFFVASDSADTPQQAVDLLFAGSAERAPDTEVSQPNAPPLPSP